MNSRFKLYLLTLVFIFQLTILEVSSQSFYLPLERDITMDYERLTRSKNIGFHTSVKPFLSGDLKNWIDTDSVEQSKNLWRKKKNENKVSSRFIEASPLFLLQTGYEISDSLNAVVSGTGIGASVSASAGEKLFLNANFITANAAFPSFINNYIDSGNIVPGEGYAHSTELGRHFRNAFGYFSYSPSGIFNFQVGHGKNFWGDGYRSLLLSDASNNYSYLKITTTVWKIKYVNLFANLKDARGDFRGYPNFKNKYGTFHYLNWNATSWLSVGLFESVIWQGKDTLSDRSFDVNYLNPVIFYRPVEFSLGSADNSLMGLNLKVKITNYVQLYSQLVIDEFLLREIRARNGWWGNKYGGQAGLKYFDAFKLNGLMLQAEFNTVRPYTYTHGSTLQNYAHFNQPLAHPLGANFYEGLGIIRFNRSYFSVEAKSGAAYFGTDVPGKNYGGDIYKSYNRIPQNYGNKTAQGLKNVLIINELRASFLILPKLNLRAEAAALFRAKYSSETLATNTFFWFGLRTSLYNIYRDFM